MIRSSSCLGVVILTIGLMSGCQKATDRIDPVASLRVINAVIGGNSIKINSSELDSISPSSSKSMAVRVADDGVFIQAESAATSNKPYYNNKIPAKTGDVFSLFLFGWPSALESLLIKEQMPDWYSDSVMGIRVAHLSPGSGAVNITLKSDPAVPILSNVRYKAVSDIVKVSLPAVIPSGNTSFEVRDAWSNELLATYNLPVNPTQLYPGISIALQRFKNITLVVKGSRDTLSGPNAFGVFPAAMSY